MKLVLKLAHVGIQSVAINDGQGEVEVTLDARQGVTPPVWIGLWQVIEGGPDKRLGEGHLRATSRGTLAFQNYIPAD